MAFPFSFTGGGPLPLTANGRGLLNGSNISNIFLIFLVFLIDNRYSGYIGNQMLFGWVTQVALSLSLGIHLAVAGGSRPTLSFLAPRPFSMMHTTHKKQQHGKKAHLSYANRDRVSEPRSQSSGSFTPLGARNLKVMAGLG